MSLRTKFGVLLGLMGLAVVLALGTAWWALDLMQREVRDPFDSMTAVLVDLGDAKRAVESAGNAVAGVEDNDADARGVRAALSPTPGQTRPDRQPHVDEFRTAAQRAHDALQRVAENPWSRTRVGASTVPNLQQRLEEVRTTDLTNDHLHSAAALQLYQIHQLIERIESRIIQDTAEALRYGGELRTRLLLVLAFALLIAALTIALGVTLVRRWVLGPIARLRAAAAKIAAGDFAHRIPIDASSHDEMARLSTEVNSMAGTIKSMQDQRVEQERLAAVGEMVRRLVHNLRNPMAGIRGLAELTRAELGPSSDLTEHQTRIITAVDRFERWLNDLLSVTRPMQVHPNPTDIAPWISGLIDAHRPLSQTRGVTLTLDLTNAPTRATFDARHLEHAVSAILSNAIEATSSPQARGTATKGGAVAVTLRDLGPNWALEVADQGSGISPETRPKIFRPYFTTKQDGNGIGLAIALQIVTAHGGRITVDSPWPPTETTPSGVAGPAGSCFTIEIPTNRPVLASESDEDMASIGQ